MQPLIGKRIGRELVAQEAADDLLGEDDRVQGHQAVRHAAFIAVFPDQIQRPIFQFHATPRRPLGRGGTPCGLAVISSSKEKQRSDWSTAFART